MDDTPSPDDRLDAIEDWLAGRVRAQHPTLDTGTAGAIARGLVALELIRRGGGDAR